MYHFYLAFRYHHFCHTHCRLVHPVALVTDNHLSCTHMQTLIVASLTANSCILSHSSLTTIYLVVHPQTPSHRSRSVALHDSTTSQPLNIAYPTSFSNIGSHLCSSKFLSRQVRTVTCNRLAMADCKQSGLIRLLIHACVVKQIKMKKSRWTFLFPCHHHPSHWCSSSL